MCCSISPAVRSKASFWHLLIRAEQNAGSLTHQFLWFFFFFKKFSTVFSPNAPRAWQSIDVDELRSLLVELPRRYNANPDDIPTSSDADLVMSALDADGDGQVDYEEWEEWVVSNRTMTEADISSFASISPTHGRLNRFVESIVKIASDKMRRLGGDQLLRGLRMMFEEFDTNENGAIDMDELRCVFIHKASCGVLTAAPMMLVSFRLCFSVPFFFGPGGKGWGCLFFPSLIVFCLFSSAMRVLVGRISSPFFLLLQCQSSPFSRFAMHSLCPRF